jgi:exodeoxyribonuclease V alpha subunit
MRCHDQTPINSGTGDRQNLAIETALARCFVVTSGGPGTGKTTTVLKILERLVSEPGGEKLRIARPLRLAKPRSAYKKRSGPTSEMF